MKNKKIGFIGAGNMASALITSIMSSEKYGAEDIIASDRNQECLSKLNSMLIKTTESNIEVVNKADIIFIAVKPNIVKIVLEEIKNLLENKNKLIVSIAAGVTIDFIESILNLENAKIIRVMPNTPCMVGEMAAGFSVNKNVIEEEKNVIEELLNLGGIAFEVAEEKLDSVTGLGGSGPAFVARLIEYFTESGEKNGLEKEIAYKLALQTFYGTAKLLKEKNMTPEELINMVSSPNGTTIAGREILENSDVCDIILRTVIRAKDRSIELR